jgi:hypothetical protein
VANTFAPFGFRQYQGTGSAPTYEQVTAVGGIDSATANISNGDPIFRLASGATGTLAGVSTGPGPGTTALAGVFVGCKYMSTSQKRTVWSNYWPGSDVSSANSALTEAYYINDPNAQFIAQVGGSTSVGVAAANIGLNVQFAYGTGNAANGISGAYIDISVNPATTSTLPFRVVQVPAFPPAALALAGNTYTQFGAYNYAVVAFNNVETKQLTAV